MGLDVICNIEGCNNPAKNYVDNRDKKTYWKKKCKSCEHLYYRYGITSPERTAMLYEQDARCKCCHIELDLSFGPGQKRKAHVDHCHVTGQVRGILCGRCNQMIGQVDEDVEVLRKMITYIEEYC